MDKYKQSFIDFLLETKSLKVGADFTLKSKRLSPYFINVGDFNEGETISRLGQAYATAIENSGKEVDILFGPAYKGIPLALATSIALASNGRNVGFAFDRKEEKDHGEVTNKADLQKAILVGKNISNGAKVIILDDVFTTGNTKYEAIDLINKLAENVDYTAVVIAVNRQEVGINGVSAIDEFTAKTGIPVPSIVKITDIYNHLKTKSNLNQKDVERIATYLRVYGTKEARDALGTPLEKRIIELDRSVIPACDVEDLEQFEDIVKSTADIEKIGGYKIGFELGYGGLGWGLADVVRTAKKYTNKPIIFDHQKAGTDIPDTGKNFARKMKKAGVDAVILFPQAGPETERAWIYHALDNDLNVIVGGRMTHPAYAVSEGGFITDEGALDMYRIAARAGVTNFVVPGNKPEVITQIREVIEAEGVSPIFYSPGFVAQGGKLSDAVKAAGNSFHGIVGRGIYAAKDKKRQAAIELTSQL